MKEGQAPREEANLLFETFVRCSMDEEEDLLAQLMSQHAEPLIDEIIRYKLPISRHADAEDVRSEILLQLLERLRKLRRDPAANPIRSFRDYVAVVSYNACSQYFRDKYPQREALKNRLRYLLRHDPRFAIWNDDEEWLCGQAKWTGRKDAMPREDLIGIKEKGINLFDERKALEKIFAHTRMPVRLEDLMELFGAGTPVESTPVRLEVVRGSEKMRGASETSMLSRLYLQEAWGEICSLPLKQRVALLLSLRDENGTGILIAFPATGVASARKIADALEMSAENFASLWKDLPLDDLRISEILGVTRQQVINLRKCSRERLSRRLAEGGRT